MKTIKTLTALAIGITMSVTMSGTALADVTCESARILFVAHYPSQATEFSTGYRVQLECLDATPAWGIGTYFLAKDQGESGYATLLTAFSLDKNIFAYVGGTGSSGSLVYQVRINR